VAQLTLRLLEFLELCCVGRCLIRIERHLHTTDAGTRVRDFRQGRFLKIGRSGNGVNQIRNQIGASLINVLYLGPALIHLLLQADKPIIATSNSATTNQSDKYNDRRDGKTTE